MATIIIMTAKTVCSCFNLVVCHSPQTNHSSSEYNILKTETGEEGKLLVFLTNTVVREAYIYPSWTTIKSIE